MEETILISYLNDFIFCPASVYFHELYGNMEQTLYQQSYQINGKDAHKTIDNQNYSSRKNILQGINIYCERYGILGKIDLFNIEKGLLTERKNKINTIYDGYIFQLYAQYYAIEEMGYTVRKMRLYSMQDNKNYEIKLPKEDKLMQEKFENLILGIRQFKIGEFEQTNKQKCENCIYEPACDRSLVC